MPAPKVTTSVDDQSTRVNSVGTYNTACVIAANKGPIDQPIKIGSQSEFLRRFTANEVLSLDDDITLYEAYNYLSLHGNLYCCRAAHKYLGVDPVDEEEFATYGSCVIKKSGSVSTNSTGSALTDPNSYVSSTDDAILIYGSSEGEWNNDIAIKLITELNQRPAGIAEKVTIPGTFMIAVYKNRILAETHICSMDPSLKNGFGVNCFIENVLTSSNYIRGLSYQIKPTEVSVVEVTPSLNNSIALDVWCIESGAAEETADFSKCYYSKDLAVTAAEAATQGETIPSSDITGIGNTTIKINHTQTVSFIAKYTGESEPAGISSTIYKAKIRLVPPSTLDKVYCLATNVAPEIADCKADKYLQSAITPTATLKINDNNVTLIYTCTVTTNVENVYIVPKEQTELLFLSGGSNGDLATSRDRIRALDKYKDMASYNVQLIMDAGYTGDDSFVAEIDEVCDALEQSCHGIISTPYAYEVGQISGDARTDLLNYRNDVLNLNTTNMELYTPHQVIYDEFNDRRIYISPSSFVAALIMKYAEELGWHWAVAGYTRGVVKSLDVATTFESTVVDDLCDAQINPILKIPGRGNIIMDELTQLFQAQDMQDCHISRYVNIYLRPRLKDALTSFLFEFNDDQTRQLVVNMIDVFMQSEKAARACYAYRVVCSEENNTPSDIENNILNCWLYLKPTKISKWIRQRIILTPYSVDLESIEL